MVIDFFVRKEVVQENEELVNPLSAGAFETTSISFSRALSVIVIYD